MKTVFSGLKPSGDMTIGNYLGAMSRWPIGQDTQRSIFFVPNLHAITVRQDPELLKKRTLDLAAWLLVCGIDPDTSIILVQSMVPEHAELAWILNNYVTMGELSRMTQFKEKAQKIGPEGQLVGLFDYPVLMAADILLYDSNEVPVGEDQAQHVEITRDIAKRFNGLYGETFVLPKATLPATGARVMSLDDPLRKMSKSDHPNSYIALLDSPEDIASKIKAAVTDSDNVISYDKETKAAISNLIEIYAGFASKSISEVEDMFAGKGYGVFKQELTDLLQDKIGHLQSRFKDFRGNEAQLLETIAIGSQKAHEIASVKLNEVKQKLGIL